MKKLILLVSVVFLFGCSPRNINLCNKNNSSNFVHEQYKPQKKNHKKSFNIINSKKKFKKTTVHKTKAQNKRKSKKYKH